MKVVSITLTILIRIRLKSNQRYNLTILNLTQGSLLVHWGLTSQFNIEIPHILNQFTVITVLFLRQIRVISVLLNKIAINYNRFWSSLISLQGKVIWVKIIYKNCKLARKAVLLIIKQGKEVYLLTKDHKLIPLENSI